MTWRRPDGRFDWLQAALCAVAIALGIVLLSVLAGWSWTW